MSSLSAPGAGVNGAELSLSDSFSSSSFSSSGSFFGREPGLFSDTSYTCSSAPPSPSGIQSKHDNDTIQKPVRTVEDANIRDSGVQQLYPYVSTPHQLDFYPHTALLRSISYGSNTTPHFGIQRDDDAGYESDWESDAPQSTRPPRKKILGKKLNRSSTTSRLALVSPGVDACQTSPSNGDASLVAEHNHGNTNTGDEFYYDHETLFKSASDFGLEEDSLRSFKGTGLGIGLDLPSVYSLSSVSEMAAVYDESPAYAPPKVELHPTEALESPSPIIPLPEQVLSHSQVKLDSPEVASSIPGKPVLAPIDKDCAVSPLVLPPSIISATDLCNRFDASSSSISPESPSCAVEILIPLDSQNCMAAAPNSFSESASIVEPAVPDTHTTNSSDRITSSKGRYGEGLGLGRPPTQLENHQLHSSRRRSSSSMSLNVSRFKKRSLFVIPESPIKTPSPRSPLSPRCSNLSPLAPHFPRVPSCLAKESSRGRRPNRSVTFASPPMIIHSPESPPMGISASVSMGPMTDGIASLCPPSPPVLEHNTLSQNTNAGVRQFMKTLF